MNFETFAKGSYSLEKMEKKKKPEDYYDQLFNLNKNIAKKINDHVRSNLLNEECAVNMEAFREEMYPPEEIELDINIIEQNQKTRDLVINDSSREFYQNKYGQKLEDMQIRDLYRAEQRKKHGFILEMAVVACLNKTIGEEYVVVHTSKHDDENGVDTLIVHKESGEVICGMDEVEDVEGGKRMENKKRKFEKNAKKGGSRIKYGFIFENGNLKRTCLNKVPTFYLRFSKEELSNLLAGMNFEAESDPTQQEKDVLKRVVEALKSHANELIEDKNNEKNKSAKQFRKALKRMESEYLKIS